MSGLAPPTLRLDQDRTVPTEGITVDLGGDATPHIDERGNILRIEYDDGSIEVSTDGRPLGNVNPSNPQGWFSNLAEKLSDSDLGAIANDLLRGIRDDDQSRKEWIEARATGMQLLGLKVEVPGLQGASDAPVEGMSRVRHPLLLEAVLRFQANSRSELLPTDGPMKIRNDDNNASLAEDIVANALEKDMNHYLTSTATEYYPDTDRMLLLLGFGGTTFKKVYHCPLRNRPVSETVNADDLIVSAQATDLGNARRVTHRVMMPPSTVRRMQIIGAYRDVGLSAPLQADLNSADRAKAAQQGVSPDAVNPDDRDREIYECYCELDIPGYEHKLNGKPSGLEIPYRVTIDVSSQQVLSVVRNYNKDSERLPEKRVTFVKYTYIPGFGFYDIGLVHILGNTTNALTAAVREMLDNGMFANFPGFLIADQGMRQNTNLVRVPPGGGAPVKTGGMAIRDAILPLPYETAHMPALMDLVQYLGEMGQRVGSTGEIPVGEGRADVPVGTILAMIDMATKIEGSVHRRMLQAQAQEFQLLLECFREHPDSFWQRKGKSAYPWDEASFLQALHDYDLVPQADPNTASHTQRVMKVMGLKQLQGATPDLYDPIAVDTAALQTLGWTSPEQFFAKPDQAQQKPEIIKGMADIEANKTKANAAMLSAQANMERVKQAGLAGAQKQVDTPVDEMNAQTQKAKLGLDTQRLHFDRQKFEGELAQSQREMAAEHHLEVLRIATDVLQRGGEDPGREASEIDKATE